MTTCEASFDTARLRALAEAATPGPWIADPPSAWDSDDDGGYQMQARVRVRDAGSLTWDDHGGEVFKPEDAAYIAAADPTTMIALLDEIERLRGESDWEYAWAGEDWLLGDEVFPSPQVAENWVGLLSTRRWVREEGGYLVRRHPATEWEPVPEGDGDE